MQLFENLQKSIINNSDENSFFINETYFKYSDFAQLVSNIRNAIIENSAPDDKIIGLVANNDLETYASIIALWFEGKCYVPINPDNPIERNENIIKEAQITIIISSSINSDFLNSKIIDSKNSLNVAVNLVPKIANEDDLAYILFTSGTTGKPKGVPITRKNVSGFIDALWDMNIVLENTDRCLQMFDLTFDLSVMSYLAPLLKGSCVYTIPKDKIKYSYIYELMEEHDLTFSLMVPSILHYLRPYFHEIEAPKMKCSLFCGEALPLDVTNEWSNCLPNARIINVYGPTEDTIFCTYYDFEVNKENKSHNGILSIGASMKNNFTIIINENNEILEVGEIGELCLGGIQLTPGYWKNEEKNKEAFFFINYNGKQERFYKTGDLCKYDNEGDLLYLGRIDFQTKIQGFRVELSEIEYFAKEFLSKINVVVLAILDNLNNTELAVVIESEKFDTTDMLDYLKTKLPVYMIPKKIEFINVFPLNVNGKIDRNKLNQLFKK
jgi:amino acid adenylation domain-containing protein